MIQRCSARAAADVHAVVAPNQNVIKKAALLQTHERHSNLRVKLAAQEPLDLEHGLGGREGGAVATAAGHGVEGVDDGEQAGLMGNGLTRQTVRIAAAVVGLVMM